LHLKYPKLCIGEVYLIPTQEYNDKLMIKNQVVYKKISKLEKYIEAFQSINNRISYSCNEYKYERVCLLIVDFQKSPPKLYSDIKDLINDNLVPANTKSTLAKLSIEEFIEDILKIYSQRFNADNLFKY